MTGGQVSNEQAQQESRDECVIRDGIEAALRENRNIDDRTARYIASQLHEGQGSALYALASSGAIEEGRIHDELTRDFEAQPDDVRNWINWLGTYCMDRADKGPVDGWAARAAEQDAAEEDDRARTELMERIQAAGVTTLGDMAVVVGGEQVEGTSETGGDDIHDGLAAAEQAGRPIDHRTARSVAQRLCAEFGRGPDSALGVLAGCGAILEDDIYEELYADIDGQSPQQQKLVDALYSYCIRREYKGPYSHWVRNPEDRATASGLQPAIWVGSLSDYNAGVLHGMWIDAYQEPEDLQAHVHWILRTSPTARQEGVVAEEYGIFDHEGFGGMRISEHELLETVSKLANGVAEHGEAFAAWAEYLGADDMDYVERTFEEAYQGTWESMQAYVENYLEESDAYSFMEYVPEWVRPYAGIDTEMLARDMEIEMYVEDSGDGHVMVFDPRL
jgi:antirestriction protein